MKRLSVRLRYLAGYLLVLIPILLFSLALYFSTVERSTQYINTMPVLLTSLSDALVLIVSEETGIISMARGGKLTRHLDQKSLKEILGGMYHEPHKKIFDVILNRMKGKEGAK